MKSEGRRDCLRRSPQMPTAACSQVKAGEKGKGQEASSKCSVWLRPSVFYQLKSEHFLFPYSYNRGVEK